MATKYLKWVYITDQTEPDPYSVFPSYFNQYLTDLATTQFKVTSPSVPEFPSSFSLALVFASVTAACIVISQKMASSFKY